MYPLNLLDFTPLFDIFKNNIVYFTVCTNHMLSHHFLPKFNEKKQMEVIFASTLEVSVTKFGKLKL